MSKCWKEEAKISCNKKGLNSLSNLEKSELCDKGFEELSKINIDNSLIKVELSRDDIDSILSWYGCTENEFGPMTEGEDGLYERLSNLLDKTTNTTKDTNKLDELISKIYEIVPAYYDEKEAKEIKKLIIKFMEEISNERNNNF